MVFPAAGPAGPQLAWPASRYESDFSELKQLGRGGYGVVVAAINRMDGRRYAIKKASAHAVSVLIRACADQGLC